MTTPTAAPTWQAHPIFTRPDHSYVITHNGYPYHVPPPSEPDCEEFAELWAEVDAFAKANPAQVQTEPGPPAPTLSETKAAKRMEIKSGYDDALIATLTMPKNSVEASPSASETAVQAALFAAEDSAGLSDVLAILNTRRQEMEGAVNGAQTVADVQAVVVNYPV